MGFLKASFLFKYSSLTLATFVKKCRCQIVCSNLQYVFMFYVPIICVVLYACFPFLVWSLPNKWFAQRPSCSCVLLIYWGSSDNLKLSASVALRVKWTQTNIYGSFVTPLTKLHQSSHWNVLYHFHSHRRLDTFSVNTQLEMEECKLVIQI